MISIWRRFTPYRDLLLATGLAFCLVGLALGQPANCDEGVIRLPDRNGTIQICSAIQSKLPQLQKQLQEATQAIVAQKAQISELTRLVRGIDVISRQVGTDRQAQMLEALTRELTRAASQEEGRAARSVSVLVDGVDDLQAQMLALASKQGGPTELGAALRGNVGDSIAKLEFGTALRQLDEIDRRLRAIEQRLGDVKGDTGKILQQVGRIEATLGEMAANFDQLRSSATLINNPRRPEEFYSNALQYEARGDLLNARQSYRRYFESGAAQFDPVERYARLVTASEGRAGAKEALRAILRLKPNLAVEAYLHALEGPADAAARLLVLLQSHPSVGPLQFLLARQYGEERVGKQSLSDLQREREALTSFLSSHERGEVLRHFIDQRLAGEWIVFAESTLKRLAGVEKVTASLTIQPSSNGWQIELNANEPVRRAFFRLRPDQPLTDLGRLKEIDPDTREPMVQSFFQVPRRTQLKAVEVFYDDLSRVRRGPIRLPSDFTDPFKVTATWQKEMLEGVVNSWVAFRPDMAIMYFTQLATSRCAIKEVRWGWGTTLSQSLVLPACDLENPFSVPDSDVFIVRFDPMSVKVPQASVQLTYFDGTKSPVKSFEIADSVLASLQRAARDRLKSESRSALDETRYDRFYELQGVFAGAWESTFGADGPARKSNCRANEPCDLRKAYGLWNDAEERIKKAGCFSSYLIADVKRHNQFRNKGYEEGSKRARQLTDSGQLVAFVAQACDAALAARREAVPVSR